MDPHLARISVYPIKSLDAYEPERTAITPAGPVEGDREFAVVDADGEYVNGKRTAAVHRLRATFEDDRSTVTLRDGDAAREFSLDDREALEGYLSTYFGYPVEVVREESGLPDDAANPGPTVISTATIEEVASWFPEFTPEGVRRRFRANLEVGGVPAFWEDRLFSDHGRVVEFSVGDVRLAGVNPCQRCVVPSRDPDTGEEHEGFRERFVEKRRETLPEWTESDRFDHPFRLMVNTRIPDASGELAVGDPVTIVGERSERGRNEE